MAIFEGRVEMYHSICTSTTGLEVAGILFNNLLNLELKSLILSPEFVFRLERALIKDATVLSSPNFVRNSCSKFTLSIIVPAKRRVPGSHRSFKSIGKQSHYNIFMCMPIQIHGQHKIVDVFIGWKTII